MEPSGLDFAERWRAAVANLQLETERVRATADEIPMDVVLMGGHRSVPGTFDQFSRHIHAFTNYTTALSCVHALMVEYDVERSR